MEETCIICLQKFYDDSIKVIENGIRYHTTCYELMKLCNSIEEAQAISKPRRLNYRYRAKEEVLRLNKK